MNLSKELQNFCTEQADASNAFDELVGVISNPKKLSEASINYGVKMHLEYLYHRDELQAARDKLTLEDLQAIASLESLLTGESFEVDIRFRKQ